MNDKSTNDSREYDWDILDKCLIQNNDDEGRKENEGNEDAETSSQEGDVEEDCEAELNANSKWCHAKIKESICVNKSDTC